MKCHLKADDCSFRGLPKQISFHQGLTCAMEIWFFRAGTGQTYSVTTCKGQVNQYKQKQFNVSKHPWVLLPYPKLMANKDT